MPSRSSCWFCPFHRPLTWAEIRRDRPELFARAVELEDLVNDRRAELDRDPVYLTRFAHPLADAIPTAQDTLPGLHGDPAHSSPKDDASCDNGACWTGGFTELSLYGRSRTSARRYLAAVRRDPRRRATPK